MPFSATSRTIVQSDKRLDNPDHILIPKDFDEDKIINILQWCVEHDDICQQIASNSKVVFDKYINKGILISYDFIESSYDDETIQTQTGSSVVSGLVFPIKSTQGSEESLLLQQGKLLTQDKSLFIGSCNVSGNIIVEIKSGDFVDE